MLNFSCSNNSSKRDQYVWHLLKHWQLAVTCPLLFIGFKPGELTIVGNIPTYPEFDLFPVAKAVAAGAESVIS